MKKYHFIDGKEARKLKAGMPSDEAAARLAETFRVLADPTRVKILYLLSKGELCVHDISQILGISQPSASHHLRILRYQGLVKSRREGKRIFYSLGDEHVLDIYRCGYEHVKKRRGE